MSRDIDRRTFLQYSGATAATAASVGLAGCGGNGNGNGNGDGTPSGDDTPSDGADAELRTYDEELPEDPSRVEVLQHANGLANALAPWVYLHQQFSIYGINDDIEWDARPDEDINVKEFSTDRDEITISQGQLLETLDPTGENSTPQYNIVVQAYEPFLYRDREGRPIALIVSDWERTAEQEVRLTIRDDVQFHNGDDMTAEDVAFSINRANNPDVSEVAGNIGDIAEARAEDGDVVLDLDSVTPTIFRNLTVFGRVLQRSWVENEDNDIATEINGTGPYELDEYVNDTRVAFTKFDGYWGEAADPNSVTFTAIPENGPRVDALIAGDSDLVTNVRPSDIPDVEGAEGVGYDDVPSTRNIFLVMNDVAEPFDSQEFRQAMNFAVDVQSIIDSILNEFGNQTSQPTLPGHNGHNPDIDPYPYDPERAEALVEESGHAGIEIELHTPVGRYLRDADVAEAAANQINELENVTCTANRRDFGELVNELLAEQSESPAFFLIGWGNPTLDGDYAMSPWFTEGAFQHFNNEELAELLQQARTIPE
ncbi:peptide ABC transporter substrate-binding protein [Natronomonas gomsonensis]|uniref:ABC transporter substrate-binding protein n=1 Tax=Natronomonas gomsonensis TaxID=1046043 RepID=UPI0020CA47D5|nr:ABC transporter substrate-binding protein [Natronomonas gomsonensis]MCY4729445.1 peptide ABC transporter substrate-binding protein [Natronomonas gomsonensis]